MVLVAVQTDKASLGASARSKAQQERDYYNRAEKQSFHGHIPPSDGDAALFMEVTLNKCITNQTMGALPSHETKTPTCSFMNMSE